MPFLKDRNKVFLSRSQDIMNKSKRNGWRHAIFNVVHDRYIGQWKNDVKCGKGTILTRNADLYEGDFANNYRHGFGILAQRQENNVFRLVYNGEFKNGHACGYGLHLFPDGSHYQGDYAHNKRNGYGQMWYADGSFYDGDWKDDMRHGKGLFMRPDGNRYEGEWEKDLKHGKGRFFHLDSGQMQEGIWVEDHCVFSILIDIPFRHCAKEPTQFPIPAVQLREESIREFEAKAMRGEIEPCLKSVTSKESTESVSYATNSSFL